jgi:dihydroxy-acid dehydratase
MSDQPKRKLRSNFPRGSYLWAGRNAHWQALGIPEEDCEKPKIAIVNSSSDLAACFSHLDRIVPVVKQAIREAGGVPFEVRTTAPSDFITGAGARGAYMLSVRDLITNDIEAPIEGALLDGMVCLTSCDKTIPGQLMAAARLNIPTIMVPCGYQASGEYKGQHVDVEDVFLGSMHVLTGKLDREDLIGMSRQAIRSPGVCTGLGTANSLHIACEALGMALPGSAPVRAMSPKMLDHAAEAGRRIVQMVWDDLKPRDILTPGAFKNAVTAVLSVGGSLNSVKHLQAVATEGQVDADVYRLFETLSPQVPVLASLRPVGERFMEEFEDAGAARALLKQLLPLLDAQALTVTGRTLAQTLEGFEVGDAEVIRPLDHPIATKPAVMVLRGSLAPETGLIKTGLGERKHRRFEGRAICFDERDPALQAIKDGTVKPGHVVVMRGAGPCGGPAMGGGASLVVFALDGAGRGDDVAMLTDGHLSGLVCKGLVVAEVSPEAARGGPLALVHDGDAITIDLDTREVNLEVPTEELERRRAAWTAPKPQFDRGWLQIYRERVSPLPQGAVLVRTGRDGA